MNITYARHLGGIQIKGDVDPKTGRCVADLGTLLIPKPLPGVNAVNPDGSAIPKVRIKPAAPGNAPSNQVSSSPQAGSDSTPKSDGATP